MENERLTYTFHAFGHPNIRATHFKTLEFTKDTDLTTRGDCIIGIKANFEKEKLKEFRKKIKIRCEVIDPETNEPIQSEFKCTVNSRYDSENELVIRKSSFMTPRTYGLNLNRGANWLDRRMLEILKNPETRMTVTILEGWKEI